MKQTNDLYTLHSICIVRYQCDIPSVRKEEKRKKVINVIYNKRNREKIVSLGYVHGLQVSLLLLNKNTTYNPTFTKVNKQKKTWLTFQHLQKTQPIRNIIC